LSDYPSQISGVPLPDNVSLPPSPINATAEGELRAVSYVAMGCKEKSARRRANSSDAPNVQLERAGKGVQKPARSFDHSERAKHSG